MSAAETLQRPPTPSLHEARVALATARRYRAEWLISVAEGLLTPLDVITRAATEEGKPLRKISLRQLLLAQPGHGDKRASDALEALAARCELPAGTDLNDLTIAWLLDPRAAGKRVLSWLDVHHPKTQPWPGFPYAPKTSRQ